MTAEYADSSDDPIGSLGPVLIANRGEIAVRVAETVHGLGLRSVAVFCEPDRGAPHADAADEAIRIDSYLDPAELIDAARRSGAGSIHPGYGFLSENANFARATIEAGLTWIGPPPEAIELMGDKAASKELARDAGVPVVPGTSGRDADTEAIAAFASEHGTPVLIKAVAGGGGKGMRVVRDGAQLESATAAARREAEAAFGDGRVLVERYLERPRHIEIQVLADSHGAVIHFGERECSLQRRHQKVIEEAPSPVVDEPMRERMGMAAVELARACGYRGAGTVEFIVPAEGEEFYFLEMNTRLQVEHPVTELVYGVDLVEGQLRVAAGQHLGPQGPIRPTGHAVEARLYAEDPAAGFLPATGEIRRWQPPTGVGIRTDAGVAQGQTIGTEYDPMLAKLIAYGPDRATALRRLDRALGELELLGIANNAAFSRALINRADIARGEQDTGLLERILEDIDLSTPDDLAVVAAVALFRHDISAATSAIGPWQREFDSLGRISIRPTPTYAAGDPGPLRVIVELGGRSEDVPGKREEDVGDEGQGPGGTGGRDFDGRELGGTRSREIEVTCSPIDDAHLRVEVDGISRTYSVALEAGTGHVDPPTVWVGRDGHHLEARVRRPERSGAGALAGSLEAPMPGKVLAIEVANGDRVSQGDLLLLLESMKMELQITAPCDGEVAGLDLSVGEQVKLGQALVAVSPAEGDGEAASSGEGSDPVAPNDEEGE